MPVPPRFLIVDDHADSRFLLVKTLFRKFPTAVFHECASSEPAIEIAGREQLAAIVTHRAADLGGTPLVRRLRQANSHVPIIMVSSVDQREAALAEGATDFLHYDEWLRIGTLVESRLAAGSAQPTTGGTNVSSPGDGLDAATARS